MTHPEDLLSAFLDGELDERARAEVTAHLAGCAECRAHVEDLAAVDALARRTEVAAPPGYFDGLTGRLRPRLRSARRRTAPAPWVWAAAAGILLAVLAPMTMQSLSRARIAAPVAAPEAAPAATLPPAPAPSDLGALGHVRPPAGGSAQALPNSTPPRAQDPALQDAQPERRLRQSARSEKLAGGRLGSVDEARPPAGPPPPAPAPPAEALAKTQGREQDAFAQAPATLAEEVTTRDGPEEKASAEKRSDRAAGLARSAPAAADVAAPSDAGPAAKKSDAKEKQEGAAFRELEAATARTAADARRVRDSWRAFARAHPDTAEGDEARVRAIEAGLLAWRLGRDRADLEAARDEGRAYLAVPGARQAERVRRALARVP